jgi:hypothetical protein
VAERLAAAVAAGKRDESEGRNMKAEIINGNLVLTLPLQKPAPSATGKTLVVATSHGNQKSEVTVQGKPVHIGVNAYIKP